LRLAVDAGPMHTRQAQVAALVALVVVATVGIGTLVAIVTARRLASPLRHLGDRASRLGAGDFRLDRARYDVRELDLVAEALDTSATALAQLVQRERELVGDVSHQLRSRLTALQLRLEDAGRDGRRGDRHRSSGRGWSRPSAWPTCSTTCSPPPARPAPPVPSRSTSARS